METQLGHLATQIPRPQGQIPGRPDENPRGQIASINLRSGKKLPDLTEVPSGSKSQLAVSVPTPNVPMSTRHGVGTDQQRFHTEVPAEGSNDTEPTEMHTESAQISTEPTQIPLMVVSPPIVIPSLPFPKKKMKDSTDTKYKKFVKVLKSLNITIPFTDALSEMPAYTKFLKEILTRKRSIPDFIVECNTLSISNQCSALIKNNLLEKLIDPGSFAITIGLGAYRYKALCDLGASTSLLPLSIWSKINMGDWSPVNMRLYMADGSCVNPT